MGRPLDRDAYKSAQRRGWSDAATGGRRWWHKLGADAVTERLGRMSRRQEADT